MTKKMKKIILVMVIVLIVGVLLIIRIPRAPEPFLTDQQVINRILSFFPESEPKVIQDVLYLDDTHVFVPFINESKEYGMSFWVWKNNKWRAASVDIGGEPQAWNGKEDSFIMWNIDPRDEVSEIRFFMRNQRSYSVSDDVATYQPGVEMMHSVKLQQQSYGVEKYPERWRLLMDKDVERNHVSIFQDFLGDSQTLQVANGFYGKDGKEVFLEYTTNGNGYTTGNNYIDFPYLLGIQDDELEGTY